mmetsp:Transcript_5557/g.17542  ORF Transcript_5557/g.17542 Transcript_5557/m.17542 type:complete len:361 (-) Transcript_5557:124-1206(-)
MAARKETEKSQQQAINQRQRIAPRLHSAFTHASSKRVFCMCGLHQVARVAGAVTNRKAAQPPIHQHRHRTLPSTPARSLRRCLLLGRVHRRVDDGPFIPRLLCLSGRLGRCGGRENLELRCRRSQRGGRRRRRAARRILVRRASVEGVHVPGSRVSSCRASGGEACRIGHRRLRRGACCSVARSDWAGARPNRRPTHAPCRRRRRGGEVLLCPLVWVLVAWDPRLVLLIVFDLAPILELRVFLAWYQRAQAEAGEEAAPPGAFVPPAFAQAQVVLRARVLLGSGGFGKRRRWHNGRDGSLHGRQSRRRLSRQRRTGKRLLQLRRHRLLRCGSLKWRRGSGRQRSLCVVWLPLIRMPAMAL